MQAPIIVWLDLCATTGIVARTAGTVHRSPALVEVALPRDDRAKSSSDADSEDGNTSSESNDEPEPDISGEPPGLDVIT